MCCDNCKVWCFYLLHMYMLLGDVVTGLTCTRMAQPVPLTGSAGNFFPYAIINNAPAGSLTACGQRCLKHVQCKSVSFDTTRGRCYLNALTSVTAPAWGFVNIGLHIVYMEATEFSQVPFTKKLGFDWHLTVKIFNRYNGTQNINSFACLRKEIQKSPLMRNPIIKNFW